MVRDGGECGDGGNCVEDQVVDSHTELQASAPLSPDVSPHRDGERLAHNALHQLANSHPGKEVLAKKKRGQRHSKDEQGCKLGFRDKSIHAIAVASHSSQEGCGRHASDAEEGGQDKDRAVFCDHFQLLYYQGICHFVVFPKGEKVLHPTFSNDQKGAAKGAVHLPVEISRSRKEAEEDDTNLERRLILALPEV